MTLHTRFARALLALGAATACTQAWAGGDVVYADRFEACTPISANGSVTSWTSIFGFSWPAFNIPVRLMMGPDSYVAIQFVAGSTGQYGTLTTAGVPGDGGFGQISISTTPGCFNPAFLGSNCVTAPTVYPMLPWMVGGNNGVCQLVSGQSYYANLSLTACAQGGAACVRDLMQVVQ